MCPQTIILGDAEIVSKKGLKPWKVLQLVPWTLQCSNTIIFEKRRNQKTSYVASESWPTCLSIMRLQGKINHRTPVYSMWYPLYNGSDFEIQVWKIFSNANAPHGINNQRILSKQFRNKSDFHTCSLILDLDFHRLFPVNISGLPVEIVFVTFNFFSACVPITFDVIWETSILLCRTVTNQKLLSLSNKMRHPLWLIPDT